MTRTAAESMVREKNKLCCVDVQRPTSEKKEKKREKNEQPVIRDDGWKTT